MITNRKVIIDTSTLIYFTEIKEVVDVFACMRSIFAQVLVPTEIKAEYERGTAKQPQRIWLLEKLKPNVGFYALCTRYDSINLAMLQNIKGIDAGEAEAVAQYTQTGAYYILSDDNRFANSIKTIYPDIRIISSLHIIALIEFHGLVIDCQMLKKQLHAKLNFKSNQLRDAYLYIAKDLGLPVSKKDISNKTSLSRILGKQ